MMSVTFDAKFPSGQQERRRHLAHQLDQAGQGPPGLKAGRQHRLVVRQGSVSLVARA